MSASDRIIMGATALAAIESGSVDDDLSWYRQRIKADFYFFCDKEVRIKNKDGDIVKFVPNPVQREMADEWIGLLEAGEAIAEVILKSRQVGITTFACIFFSWLLVCNDARSAMVLAQDDDAVETLYEMYSDVFEGIDKAVKPPLTQSNKQSGYRLDNKSSCRIATAGTAQTASKVGRSKTNQYLHLSELAFWSAAKKTLAGVRATVKKFGTRSIIAIESTPNGASGEFFNLYNNAKKTVTGAMVAAGKKGKNGYRARFIPWHVVTWEYSIEPTVEQMACWYKWRETGSEKARVDGGFHPDNHDQIDTHRLQCGQWLWWSSVLWSEYEGDEEVMMQEYPSDDVSCFKSSGRPVFPYRDLKALEDHIRPGTRFNLRYAEAQVGPDGEPALVREDAPNGAFECWEEPVRGATYIAIADVCAGFVGKDQDASTTGMYKIGGAGMEKVAAYYGQPDPSELGDYMNLFGRYYNMACATPEVQSYGITTLRRLLYHGYNNIYRRMTWDQIKKTWQRNELGWSTDGTSRYSAINALKRLLRERRYITHDAAELDELWAFIYNAKSNKEQAAEGAKDDRVLTACIAARVYEDHEGRPEVQKYKEPEVTREAWGMVVDFLESKTDDSKATGVLKHLRESGYYRNFS